MPPGPEKKPAASGRGRPRNPPAEASAEVPEKKKRGRKPGLLSKKTLANQKRQNSRMLKKAAALPEVQKLVVPSTPVLDPPANVRPRQILVMLLLALPLPADLGPVPKMEPAETVKPERAVSPRSKSRHALPVFVEPQLAVPKPGYLGFPLEALPPNKSKPKSTGRGRKPKDKGTPSPDLAAEAAAAEAESSYASKLETARLDQLTEDSELRTPVRPLVKKRGRPPNKNKNKSVPSTPKSIKRKSDGTPGSRNTKRLKITLPRKPSLSLVPNDVEPPADEEDASDNDDYCAACGGTGIFICCDSCPKSFHLLCCDPPIREVPEDNWNCNDCRAAQGMDVRRLWNEIGLFGPLVNSLHGRNPFEFRLPKRLRDGTFISVSSGDGHQYTDTLLKPELSYSKINGGQLVGYNKNEDLDIDGLYDKDGKPYLCHRCRKSGLQRRTLVSCDYCPLRWHLDCLAEPLALAKTLGLKWRCPNHVESLLPPNWLEHRSFRDTTVIDAAMHSHFLQLMQTSNFLIKHNDQPYLSDHRQPLLHEYLQYQKEDFVSNKMAFVDEAEKANFEETSENEDDLDPKFKVPDFLQNYAVDGRVVSRGSRRLGKVLLMTNADDPEQKPFIYRVPEQQVLLDFISTRNTKNQIMKQLRSYEEKATEEEEQDANAVEVLEQLQKTPVEKMTPLNLDELVAAAMSTLRSETGTTSNNMKSDGSMSSANVSLDSSNNRDLPLHSKSNGTVKSSGAKRGRKPGVKVSKEELQELRQIKKLLEIKGKDAMLAFLLS